MKKLIIHAPNIHYGGGRTLLIPLLETAKQNYSVTAFLDKRLVLPDERAASEIDVQLVDSTTTGRIAAEYKLKQLVCKEDIVICFGNLPPLFRLKSRVILFIQNRYLVNKIILDGFSIRVRIRILIERLWLKLFFRNAHKIVVQSSTMQRLVYNRLGKTADIMPFFDYETIHRHIDGLKTEKLTIYDFLYVASGEPQKNHLNLFKAWRLLANDGIYPKLCTTLHEGKYPSLVNIINKINAEYGLKITNISPDNQYDLNLLYNSSGALIYPSTLESFGLPLIEAKVFNLPVLASELDYVRDVVDPAETFDPLSPVSIARAVKRFIGKTEKPMAAITPAEFIDRLIIR